MISLIIIKTNYNSKLGMHAWLLRKVWEELWLASSAPLSRLYEWKVSDLHAGQVYCTHK